MGSSTSSVHKSFRYDVFLSFRGDDTRKNFVDHLYVALERQGINTYKDDERIEQGERIGDELMKSIEDSKFYIIVFSKNYASSSWCLDELVKIMGCQKMTEHIAYPLFYDVEPSEVRNQRGAVGDAFSKHEKEEAAGKWRDALKEAADLAGWELKNTENGHEAKFINKVVEKISIELCYTNLNIDEKLVGMDLRIKVMKSSLEIGVDDVRMIGIKGIGGGGKTTLARAIYDNISSHFEGTSFIDNVREVSKTFGLQLLQKQVLSDVLKNQGINVSNVHLGKSMIKKRLCGKKVLLVLDDVDHIEQLDALAGDLNWFKTGSRIIITTRDEQVLIAHGVKLINNVNLLSNEEAISLFSRYAFGKETPVQMYKDLSGQVVRYAAGLPLTIMVLGSFLSGKSELEWFDAIKRLKTIPLKETLEKLELSYMSLEDDYKEIFLDVACIMKGWPKKYVISILESCGYHARIGLRVLEQKSLIYKSQLHDNERIGMHDHIEEMGKKIVRRENPGEPKRHSRLWILEEIEDVLANDLGTKATRSINVPLKRFSPEIFIKGVGRLKKLKILRVFSELLCNGVRSDWKFDKSWQYFPNSLRSLRWECYPFRSLPNSYGAENLVTLEMFGSKIVQLWEGGEQKVLKNLTLLDLSFSKLRKFDLEMTPNLETLNLQGCYDLVMLIIPPLRCSKLRSLNLSDSNLESLDLTLSSNLEMIILNQCHYLIELHMPINGCLKLTNIELICSKLTTLDLRLIPNLESVQLVCDELVKLQMPISECLKLTYFKFVGSKLVSLDLQLTPNLEKLSIKNYDGLVELHMPINGCPKLTDLELLGSKLRSLDLSLTPNLEKLDILDLDELLEVNMPINGFLKLKDFKLIGAKLSTLNLHGTDQNTSIKEACDEPILRNHPSRPLTHNIKHSISSKGGKHRRVKSAQLKTKKIRTMNLFKLVLINNHRKMKSSLNELKKISPKLRSSKALKLLRSLAL